MKNINEYNSADQANSISSPSGLRAFVLSSILLLAGCGAVQQQNTDTVPKPKNPSAEPDDQPKENQSIVSNQQSVPEAVPEVIKEDEVQKEIVISPTPPELSDFVKGILEGLKNKKCKEGGEDIKPEIRGIIKGDNIEALVISYGGNKWEFFFSPPIGGKESEKMFGVSAAEGGSYYSLLSTSICNPNKGVIENNNASKWLLGEMKSLPSFKNPEVLWSADEKSPGIADMSDCAQ